MHSSVLKFALGIASVSLIFGSATPSKAAQTHYTTFAAFIAPVNNEPGKPAWLKFSVGMTVFVYPDPSGAGASSHVCMSVSQVEEALAESDPSRCAEEPAGALAQVVSVTMGSPQAFNAAPFIVGVREIHGRWSGYVPWGDISPVPPIPIAAKLVRNSDFATGYKDPRLSDTDGGIATHIVQPASIRVIRYDASSGTPQAEVVVLSGPRANERGWVDSLSYIKTGKGDSISCFCTRQ